MDVTNLYFLQVFIFCDVNLAFFLLISSFCSLGPFFKFFSFFTMDICIYLYQGHLYSSLPRTSVWCSHDYLNALKTNDEMSWTILYKITLALVHRASWLFGKSGASYAADPSSIPGEGDEMAKKIDHFLTLVYFGYGWAECENDCGNDIAMISGSYRQLPMHKNSWECQWGSWFML